MSTGVCGLSRVKRVEEFKIDHNGDRRIMIVKHDMGEFAPIHDGVQNSQKFLRR